MANITKQRTGVLIRTLFEILKAQPDGMRAVDALAALEQLVTLTEYEAGNYDAGGRRFEKIVRFGTVAPVKAGWMVKDKGVWTVTDDGIAALAAFPDPEEFTRAGGRLYKKWKKAQPVPEVDEEDEDISEGSAIITLEQAEEMAWSEIETYLAAMPPYEFQELVAALLQAMATTLPGSLRRGRMVVRHRGLQRPTGHAAAAHQGAGEAQCELGAHRRDAPAQLHGRVGRG